MTTPQAIFLSALVIAASLIAANGVPSARASINGPYQLMHHSNPNANAGVFRLDVTTGDVSYCFVSASNELVCSRTVK